MDSETRQDVALLTILIMLVVIGFGVYVAELKLDHIIALLQQAHFP